jgi:hypothetical protein
MSIQLTLSNYNPLQLAAVSALQVKLRLYFFEFNASFPFIVKRWERVVRTHQDQIISEVAVSKETNACTATLQKCS